MNFTTLSRTALVLALEALPSIALAMPPEERVKVKQLVGYIESLPQTRFVRNGRSYSAAEAAQFMRLKCEAKMDKLATAREYVEQCFTRSSTSKEVYHLRDATGVTKESGVVLNARLDEIEAAARKK